LADENHPDAHYDAEIVIDAPLRRCHFGHQPEVVLP